MTVLCIWTWLQKKKRLNNQAQQTLIENLGLKLSQLHAFLSGRVTSFHLGVRMGIRKPDEIIGLQGMREGRGEGGMEGGLMMDQYLIGKKQRHILLFQATEQTGTGISSGSHKASSVCRLTTTFNISIHHLRADSQWCTFTRSMPAKVVLHKEKLSLRLSRYISFNYFRSQ